MPITIDCPNCEKTLRINDSAAGKKVKCPKCQELFRVPAEPVEEEEPVEDEEAAEERPARREKTKKSGQGKGKSKEHPGNKSLVLGLAISGGVLALLLIGGIIWYATRDNSSDTPRAAQRDTSSNISRAAQGDTSSKDKQVVSMTADAFFAEWNQNKGNMESRYRNTLVDLTGIVQDVKCNALKNGYLYLALKEKAGGLPCYTEDRQPWTKVSVGQEVKVRGSVHDYLSYAEIRDCVFVDSNPNPVPTITAEQLVKDYLANSDALFAKYKGKRLILTGEIAFKREESLYLKGNETIPLECTCPETLPKEINELTVGQKVKILARVPEWGNWKPNTLQNALSFHDCRIID